MLALSGCGEAFWSVRGGDESMESNSSGFAELLPDVLGYLASYF